MATLVIDQPMDDSQVEVLMEQLADHDAVEIRHHDLGGAVVQLLLCASAEKAVKVAVDAASLRMLFENPQVAKA